MTDENAWASPADPETVAETVGMVVSLVEPDADENRVQVLTRYLCAQDYTEAEIRYAARELPKDEHLDNKMRYGKPMTPADFERVISRVRKLRRLVNETQKIPEEDIQPILDEMPELSREDFQKVSEDRDGSPLYSIVPSPNRQYSHQQNA